MEPFIIISGRFIFISIFNKNYNIKRIYEIQLQNVYLYKNFIHY